MTYEAPVYPGAIPTQTTPGGDLPDVVDDVTWITENIYNDLKKELCAVMAELGTNPKGAFADVKTRLNAIPLNGYFGIDIDGAGAEPETGSKGFLTIPYACTILNWYIVGNVSGDAVIDIKRSGTSIIGGAGNKPTLTSAASANAAAASWTSVNISAGDLIEFNLDSIDTITHLNLVLKVLKT